ncbi:uncharacterized protein LOC129592968 [Paramacrobiotus metropolitanus]|uniref:uncharacterized protein LOC129592968 n=1 Tax=Paramacrobiotus metropolitanus TaxID=2943436 RepID=UPI002445DC99|nr:uncharacterized protein LOC129592968 [Paramacrobiotus metropolitanus]
MCSVGLTFWDVATFGFYTQLFGLGFAFGFRSHSQSRKRALPDKTAVARLPRELLSIVFDHLNIVERRTMARVCMGWRLLICQPVDATAWHLRWKHVRRMHCTSTRGFKISFLRGAYSSYEIMEEVVPQPNDDDWPDSVNWLKRIAVNSRRRSTLLICAAKWHANFVTAKRVAGLGRGQRYELLLRPDRGRVSVGGAAEYPLGADISGDVDADLHGGGACGLGTLSY